MRGSYVIILVTFVIVFSITILSSTLVLPAYSQSSSIHEINVSEEFTSVDIPIIGTLKIIMEYSADFEIRKPSSIEAGDSATVSIVPRTGNLYITTFLDNSNLGTVPIQINMGERKSVPLIGGLGFDVHIVASPTAKTQSSVTGPATISPRSVSMDSIGPRDFQIYVQENIGTSNQIHIKFPVTLYIAATGGIGYVIGEYDLDPILIPFTTKTLTETISIYKNYNTKLSLQVSDGSKTGYIKVNPKLTYDNGNYLTKSVSIYVDGAKKTTVSSNQWSSDINVGTGTHNIKAKFFESKSSNNNAITFLESQSSVKQVNVKSSSSSITTQPKSYTTTQTSNLPDNTLILIILAIAGGGGAAAVIIVKNKKKTPKSPTQNDQNTQTKSAVNPSAEKQDILQKFASGDISKEEYLKHLGYEKKETLPEKSEKPKKEKSKKLGEDKK